MAQGLDQDDIADAMREKLKVIPGIQIVMAQPISDRVDEMVTGVRSTSPSRSSAMISTS
jgi:cobalt-zinc-cadmium resistance protein CzcA